jgi:hypothetical protein
MSGPAPCRSSHKLDRSLSPTLNVRAAATTSCHLPCAPRVYRGIPSFTSNSRPNDGLYCSSGSPVVVAVAMVELRLATASLSRSLFRP